MSSPHTGSIRLFSSDLDGTLLGNPESTRRFKAALENRPAIAGACVRRRPAHAAAR